MKILHTILYSVLIFGASVGSVRAMGYFYYDVTPSTSTLVFGDTLSVSQIDILRAESIESFKDIEIHLDVNQNDANAFFEVKDSVRLGEDSRLLLFSQNDLSLQPQVMFQGINNWYLEGGDQDLYIGEKKQGKNIVFKKGSADFVITGYDAVASERVIISQNIVLQKATINEITANIFEYDFPGFMNNASNWELNPGSGPTPHLTSLKMVPFENNPPLRIEANDIYMYSSAGDKMSIIDLRSKRITCETKRTDTGSARCDAGWSATGGACGPGASRSAPTQGLPDQASTMWFCENSAYTEVRCCKFD